LDVLAAGFEVSPVLGSVLTSFSDVCFRRSLASSGSSICADCPLTTRSDPFAVPVFFEEARVGRDTGLGDLDLARDLELSLRFDLPPNVSSSAVLVPWGRRLTDFSLSSQPVWRPTVTTVFSSS
jgi:hypothetical protein